MEISQYKYGILQEYTRHSKKVASVKNFAIFFNNYTNKILHISCPFNLSQMWKILLHYLQNWQNCAAFNHGNLTFWRCQKWLVLIALTTSANTISVNTSLSYSTCWKCLPPAFTYSLNFSKTWENFVLGKIFACSLQCATFNTEAVFGLQWSFQKDVISARGSVWES